MKGALRVAVAVACGLLWCALPPAAARFAADDPLAPEPRAAVSVVTGSVVSTGIPSTSTSVAPAPRPTAAARLPRLPVPDPLPADPYAADPDRPIGRIAIPAIGLDAELGSGMTLTEIDRGPAHWPGTALPGSLGNVVVAGHRTTWTAPFRHLDALEPGDEVHFTIGGRQSVYLVTRTFVVEPTELWIADQAHRRIVTLFACHPVGSAAQRIVVRAELVPAPVPSSVV